MLRLVRRRLPGLLVTALALFISAGTLKFWQSWAILGLFLGTTMLQGVYFLRRDPQLLARRLLSGEKTSRQKIIMLLIRANSFGVFALCGLDHRFDWTSALLAPVPAWLSLLALALMLAGDLMIIWIWDANRFAASIVQVESGQTIADTGPYRFVRHPMYAVALAISLLTPLALGSLVAVPAYLPVIPVIIWRLINEEKTLRRDLPGYVEYCQRTRHRLIPGIW